MFHLSTILTVLLLFLCSGSVSTVAIAMVHQNTQAAVSSKGALTSTPSHIPDMCFDGVFQGPLPGKLDYCLGLRDWAHGHYHYGMEFLKLAAGWGNKNAQYTLGLIYYGGHHVPIDTARGLAWLKLANERHNDPQIERVVRSAFKWATPTLRQRAEQLYAKMSRKYADRVAAARAQRRLAHWQFSHDVWSDGCAYLYPAQAWALRRLMSERVPVHPAGKKAHSLLITCIALPRWRSIVQKTADQYFRGLNGTVSVGPLEQIPAPDSSSGH